MTDQPAARPQAQAILRIDEPHVRVTEYRFAEGAETGWHRHGADYVVVPLADGDLLLEEPGGTSRIARLTRHVPYARREGVEHNVVNANPGDYAFIEIEMMAAPHDHGAPDTAAVEAMLARFVAAWNAHDLAGIMACFAEDCSFWASAGPDPRGAVHEGRAAVEAATAAIFTAYPDAAWIDGRTTVVGDRALWEWTFTGTNAAGAKVRVAGTDILDLVGDRIRRKNSFRKQVVPA